MSAVSAPIFERSSHTCVVHTLRAPRTSPHTCHACRRQVRPAGRLPHLPGNFPHPLFFGLRQRPTAPRPGGCGVSSRPRLGQRHPRRHRRRSARVQLRRRRCRGGGGGAIGGDGEAGKCGGGDGLRGGKSRDRYIGRGGGRDGGGGGHPALPSQGSAPQLGVLGLTWGSLQLRQPPPPPLSSSTLQATAAPAAALSSHVLSPSPSPSPSPWPTAASATSTATAALPGHSYQAVFGEPLNVAASHDCVTLFFW